MHFLAGTSGFSYKEWKGNFYPAPIAGDEMLRYYAERLPAVEIDNTFYRMPRAEVLAGWASQVPPAFRFTLKASRRITHFKRLKDAGDETSYLLRVAESLGETLGAILFQLPPNLKKDRDRLARFLDLLPESTPAAFEFRARDWFDQDILDLLAERSRPLCIVDAKEESEEGAEGTGEKRTGQEGTGEERKRSAALPSVFAATASWGYLRLRRESYDDAALEDWRGRIAEAGWDRAFVFFKHEDAGAAPAMARRFLQIAGVEVRPEEAAPSDAAQGVKAAEGARAAEAAKAVQAAEGAKAAQAAEGAEAVETPALSRVVSPTTGAVRREPKRSAATASARKSSKSA